MVGGWAIEIESLHPTIATSSRSYGHDFRFDFWRILILPEDQFMSGEDGSQGLIGLLRI
jgi:hypothetical protein